MGERGELLFLIIDVQQRWQARQDPKFSQVKAIETALLAYRARPEVQQPQSRPANPHPSQQQQQQQHWHLAVLLLLLLGVLGN